MNIIQTIQNLVAKAESTDSEAEANLFFAKAAQLATKHGIEKHELETKEGKPAGFEFGQFNINGEWKNEQSYHKQIRRVLQSCMHVSPVRHTYHTTEGKRVAYYLLGTADDCAFASFAFDYLCRAFKKLWNVAKKANGWECTSRVYNAYYRGLADGMIMAYREGEAQASAGTGFAMVLRDKDTALAKHIEDMTANGELGKPRTMRRSIGDGEAYHAGTADGRKIKVQRAVGAGVAQGALT